MHKCAYTRPVSYEWDPAKARANFEKHGIFFADAAATLEDDLALTMRDPFSDDEERWITLVKMRRVACSLWFTPGEEKMPV
jgi:uncharacterized DUF497 family protein